MVFLSIKDLDVYYTSQKKKIHAVDSLSFEVQENESVGIAGESGSGKSTLGLAIIKSLQENATVTGDIIFQDLSIYQIPKSEFENKIRWKNISMIFQGAMNSLDPTFTIKKQFEEILKVHKFTGNYSSTIENIIEQMSLPKSILDKFPHEISGGMKQRVVIAMGLILRPKLVIADEPTTALDVLVQAQIIKLLKTLKKEGLTIMTISHDLGIISEISEKIAIMYAGKIVEYGDSTDILQNPRHPYTVSLLESIPKIKEQKNKLLKENQSTSNHSQTGCRFYDRCPKAMEKCKSEPPKSITKSGFVFCWLNEE